MSSLLSLLSSLLIIIAKIFVRVTTHPGREKLLALFCKKQFACRSRNGYSTISQYMVVGIMPECALQRKSIPPPRALQCFWHSWYYDIMILSNFNLPILIIFSFLHIFYRGCIPPLWGSGIYRSTQFAVFEGVYVPPYANCFIIHYFVLNIS